MPAPASEERSHFFKSQVPIVQKDGSVSDKHHWWVCKKCQAAHVNSADNVAAPELIRDRADAYRSHLKRCPYHRPEAVATTLPVISSVRSISSIGSSSSTAAKRQKRMSDFFMSMDEQHSFERDLLEFQAECALPDYFIERDSTKRLFARMQPRYELPTRKELGGRILKINAESAETASNESLREKQEDTGGRINYLSDVYQNVARRHLFTCQLCMFGIVVQFELLPVDSAHHGIAIAKQMEGSLMRALALGWIIGAVVTDDAGQCARARRILALRWPNIVFLRCFAHDVNNLVKAVLKTVFKTVTKQAASATASLNSSSAKWLVRANERVYAMYGETLAFIMLCETRWNSMQACFASLLRVRSALEDLAHGYRYDVEFPTTLHVFRDPLFWRNLIDAERVIRPLSEASYRLQKDDNTMADVVRCFGKIHAAFVASPYASHLVPVVEKRWANCEQPLMLLAFALHPLYVTHTRALIQAHDNTVFLMSVDGVSAAADYYYRRYVDLNSNGLVGDVDKWLRGKFTPKKHTDFTDQAGVLQPNGVIDYWVHVADSWYGKGSKLPQLAKVILSVAVNTATCERYFSELGSIQTPRRNKLKFDKARLIGIIRNEVRERNRRESDIGECRRQKKPVDPAERPKQQMHGVSDPATSLSALADVTDVDYMETVGAVDFWLDAIVDLDDDGGNIVNNVGDEEWYVYDPELEPVPVANRSQELPDENNPSYPQEKLLTGLRAQQVTLETLFSSWVELPAVAASPVKADRTLKLPLS